MRMLSIALALLGTSLLPLQVLADPVPIQSFETSLTLNGALYACVQDPSSWRQANDAHDALVDQGYGMSIWIAVHPGFAPFSDQVYFLCRLPEATEP